MDFENQTTSHQDQDVPVEESFEIINMDLETEKPKTEQPDTEQSAIEKQETEKQEIKKTEEELSKTLTFKIIQKNLELLLHSTKCRDPECSFPNCELMTDVLTRTKEGSDIRYLIPCSSSGFGNARRIANMQSASASTSTSSSSSSSPSTSPSPSPSPSPLISKSSSTSKSSWSLPSTSKSSWPSSSTSKSPSTSRSSWPSPSPSTSRSSWPSPSKKDVPEKKSPVVRVAAKNPSTFSLQNSPLIWQNSLKYETRHHFLQRIILAIYPTPAPYLMNAKRMSDAFNYAKTIEFNVYKSAKSKLDYYHLMVGSIEKVRKAMDKRPVIGQQNMNAVTLKKTKPWHYSMTDNLRNQLVFTIVQAILPSQNGAFESDDDRMNDLIDYAKTVESDCWKLADSRSQYYKLVANAMGKVQLSLERILFIH